MEALAYAKLNLALEVLGHRQAILGDLDLVEPSPKSDLTKGIHARLWTNVPDAGGAALEDGAPLNKAEYDRWIARKDEFKIFVLDKMESFSRKIGVVYLNGSRISDKKIDGHMELSDYDGDKLSSAGYRFFLTRFAGDSTANQRRHALYQELDAVDG